MGAFETTDGTTVCQDLANQETRTLNFTVGNIATAKWRSSE